MKHKFSGFRSLEKLVLILSSIIVLTAFLYLISIPIGLWNNQRKMEELLSYMDLEDEYSDSSGESKDNEFGMLEEIDSQEEMYTEEEMYAEEEVGRQKRIDTQDENDAKVKVFIQEEINSHKQIDILPKFTKLYEENSDIIGWLSIKDTKINYPVMYTPDEPEYYLHLNFDKEYEKRGLPFLDGNTDFINSSNYIIYGHNMHDGTGFKDLLKYKDESFYKVHPVITFDTLYELAEYEVISAFYSKIYYEKEEVFKYYKYIDILDELSFKEYVSAINELSLYNIKSNISYGDQLITLSTCSYHTEEGRFVVVAKKK